MELDDLPKERLKELIFQETARLPAWGAGGLPNLAGCLCSWGLVSASPTPAQIHPATGMPSMPPYSHKPAHIHEPRVWWQQKGWPALATDLWSPAPYVSPMSTSCRLQPQVTKGPLIHLRKRSQGLAPQGRQRGRGGSNCFGRSQQHPA